MNSNLKLLLGINCIFALLLAGCAGVQARKANVNIETESAAQIRIFDVAVKSTPSTVIVTGTLHKRSHGRTTIPGHIDITFISPDGEQLKTVRVEYHRPSINSRDSRFKTEIPLNLPDDSTVRIEHFRKSIH